MMSIGRNNTLQDENFEECFLIYVRPQGKKSTLWICFNAYRLSLWDTPYSRGFML